MEPLFAAARRRYWSERPGGVSWGLRIQRAACGRGFRASAPRPRTGGQGPRLRRLEKVFMPGTTAFPDEELIVEDLGGGGGGPPLPPGGGDDGGDKRGPTPGGRPSPNRYYTGIALGIVSILMFFM